MSFQVSGDLTEYSRAVEKKIADEVAAEREACAKEVDDAASREYSRYAYAAANILRNAADAIRKRGGYPPVTSEACPVFSEIGERGDTPCTTCGGQGKVQLHDDADVDFFPDWEDA